jgi:hypothetical protein
MGAAAPVAFELTVDIVDLKMDRVIDAKTFYGTAGSPQLGVVNGTALPNQWRRLPMPATVLTPPAAPVP